MHADPKQSAIQQRHRKLLHKELAGSTMLSKRSQVYSMNAASPSKVRCTSTPMIPTSKTEALKQKRRRNRPDEEDFIFWSPPCSDDNASVVSATSSKQIPAAGSYPIMIVEEDSPVVSAMVQTRPPNARSGMQQGRRARPRMGVPMVTSTPQQQIPPKTQEEDEPIYCEIGGSKTPVKSIRTSPVKSAAVHLTSHKPLPPPKPVRTFASRPDLVTPDFTRISPYDIELMNTKARKLAHRKSCDLSSPTKSDRPVIRPSMGLGRRAVTQLDMEVTSKRRKATNIIRDPELYSDCEFQRRPTNRKQSDYHSDQAFDDTISTATTSVANQSVTPSVVNATTLKKGLLWQQRDKLFSRWKERFFVLTTEYLQCFKKGSSKISEMGGFIFRIRLAEIEEIELLDKRGYLTISLTLSKEGKILLRKPEGIREWFQMLSNAINKNKERRVMMKTTKEFWSKKQFTDSSSMEQWILARNKIGRQYAYDDPDRSVQQAPILPNHLRDLAKRQQSVGSVRTINYGYIDSPHDAELSQRLSGIGIDSEQRHNLATSYSDYVLKKGISHQHDSGVDSMNTNSSGSVMSSSRTSPSSDTSRLTTTSTARGPQEEVAKRSRRPPRKQDTRHRMKKDYVRNVSVV